MPIPNAGSYIIQPSIVSGALTQNGSHTSLTNTVSPEFQRIVNVPLPLSTTLSQFSIPVICVPIVGVRADVIKLVEGNTKLPVVVKSHVFVVNAHN